jgi:tRNA-guanine family transglycosylase
MPFSFKLLKKSAISQARLGLLETPHGIVKTPAFVPIATEGAVKTLTPKELEEIVFKLFWLILIISIFVRELKQLKKQEGFINL